MGYQQNKISYLSLTLMDQKERLSVFRININDKFKKQFLGVRRYMTKKVKRMENGLSYVKKPKSYSDVNKNSRKYSIGDILHQRYSNRPFQLIGFGNYNVQGLKNGKWVEQSENFQRFDVYVNYEGRYKNGRKVGQWDIKLENDYIFYKLVMELMMNKDLKTAFGSNQVIIIGNFNNLLQQQIQKRGHLLWRILKRQRNLKMGNLLQKLGGGLYSDSGVKNGYCIELYESFWSWNEVIYKFHNMYFYLSKFLSCGGTYDDQNLKNGNWDDQFDRFYRNQGYKILYCYLINGRNKLMQQQRKFENRTKNM
ncbi:unnamed protein product [Paramecium primaurelia]|uniref:Uncharacterized protein n=1 Tax=Paramecium primaurelia TaxID=5886 RepID=A0A8S1PGH8_PARPR|nr:unnamed protein product [Paramecium primaurelia]